MVSLGEVAQVLSGEWVLFEGEVLMMAMAVRNPALAGPCHDLQHGQKDAVGLPRTSPIPDEDPT